MIKLRVKLNLIKMNKTIFVLIFLYSVHIAYCQDIKKVYGEYIYYAPTHLSPVEASKNAIEQAKIQILADEFGTIISQNNSLIIQSNSEGEFEKFNSISEAEVKGEWIETIGNPDVKMEFINDGIVVNVKIKGKARQIVSSEVDLKIRLLKNGLDSKYESVNFNNGDDMYLQFSSPIDGYLTVYLLNEDDMNVYCLLPYEQSTYPSYKINQNIDYIFFSSKMSKIDEVIDEYSMICESEKEYNTLYVIFSPNYYIKANSENSPNAEIPRVLSYINFKKWLVKNRKIDTQMTCVKMNIILSR